MAHAGDNIEFKLNTMKDQYGVIGKNELKWIKPSEVNIANLKRMTRQRRPRVS